MTPTERTTVQGAIDVLIERQGILQSAIDALRAALDLNALPETAPAPAGTTRTATPTRTPRKAAKSQPAASGPATMPIAPTPTPTTQKLGPSTAREKVLAYLAGQKGPASLTQIVAATNVGQGNVNYCLTTLERAKRVRRIGFGNATRWEAIATTAPTRSTGATGTTGTNGVELESVWNGRDSLETIRAART